MSVAQKLIWKRQQPHRWLFLIAAIPFFLTGLVGFDYGSALPYLAIAVVSVLQFAFPTLLGWGAITVVYAVSTAWMIWQISASAAQFVTSHSAGVLVDADDSLVVVLLAVAVIGMLIALLRSRPLALPEPEPRIP